MRKYGTIGDVYFVYQGFDIYHLAEKYELSKFNEKIIVYVDNMKELKVKIAEFHTGASNEQDKIQM